MLNIKTFQCNMLAENCFIVSDDTHEAVIIDCGAFYAEEREAIDLYIRREDLKPVRLLCTHGHLDHCFGNIYFYQKYGLQPEICEADMFLAADMEQQAQQLFGFRLGEATPPVAHYLKDQEEILFGNHELKVLATPGHTPGSVVFYCQKEGVVFSGDTLFRMSIGRTDFEGGSWEQMHHSLCNVMAKLPDTTKVYCGHGPSTVIGEEKQMNPNIR